MMFGSVCSGIEAASVAWKPLGWRAAWLAEIEKFPSDVLAFHHRDVPNLGDMTKLTQSEVFNDSTIDILVGGTPCQSFSVAGLRKGLADPRGNLALHFIALLDRKRPPWVVWENVPGVLSSWTDEAERPATADDYAAAGQFDPGEGRRGTVVEQSNDFDTFTSGLRELGYGLAWRVLDAQYFGVPQRRRRVFVVGYLGDWRRAAAVLFECASLRGNPPPSRQSSESVAGPLGSCSESGGSRTTDLEGNGAYVESPIAFGSRDHGGDAGDTSPTLRASGHDKSHANGGAPPAVAYGLRTEASEAAGGPQATEERTKALNTSSPPAVVYPILEAGARTGKSTTDPRAGLGIGEEADPMFTLQAGKQHAVVYENHAQDSRVKECDVSPQINARAGTSGGNLPLAITPPPALFSIMPMNSGKDYRAREVDVTQPLMAAGPSGGKQGGDVVVDAVSFKPSHFTRGKDGAPSEVTPPLSADADNRSNPQPGAPCHTLPAAPNAPMLASAAVRRLTPRECERLQGFPDDYTAIPQGKSKKKTAPDGPRYKALGNSMAVPVMAWLGRRIQAVEDICREPKK